MFELEQFYTNVGGNYQEISKRLGGNDDIIKHFLTKFLQDKCFEKLKIELENNNTEESFNAVHTLKGVSANLEFTNLYNEAYKITELLRNKDINKAKEEFYALDKAYNQVINEIHKIIK